MSFGDILGAPARAVRGWFGGTEASERPGRQRTAAGHVASTGQDWLLALRHRRLKTRLQAIEQVGVLGWRHAAGDLERIVLTDHRQARQAALWALLQIDPEHFAETAVLFARRERYSQIYADLDAVMELAARQAYPASEQTSTGGMAHGAH